MTYQTEFPDFPATGLPAIPSTWKDVSWHNDTCPSWDAPSGATVFIDYADDAEREMPGGSRFVVMNDGFVALESDDWSEILEAVK